MVDCNEELTDMLGNRMTSSEFNDQYNSTIEELTQDSLNDMNIDDPSSDEWNEEYESMQYMSIFVFEALRQIENAINLGNQF